ncbi:hypothetical protein H4R35_006339 [Dimargaris xerosporica]|nr:hypothetical protein H4R35_006339 [Dimargaris xerosporica]
MTRKHRLDAEDAGQPSHASRITDNLAVTTQAIFSARLDTLPSPSSVQLNCSESTCSHTEPFLTLQALEAHYECYHRYCCAQCQAVFPNARLLDVHLMELHDPFFALKRDRGDRMYECLVAICACRFLTNHDRNQHMIESHYYPAQYQFSIIRDGYIQSDNTLYIPSMKRPRPALETTESLPILARSKNAMDVDSTMVSSDTGELPVFVPRAVRFGRR